MKKYILWQLILLLFVPYSSIKAQSLVNLESIESRAYDFWGPSKIDKDIYVYSQNVSVNPIKTLPIKLIYSYDYKRRMIRYLLSNSNSYMILSKECNKRVNKFLKKCSYVNFQGDDIEKMMIEYRKALNSKYQHHNDSVRKARDIAKQEKARRQAIEDSIRLVKESKTHIRFMGIELNDAVDLVILDLRKKGFETIDFRKNGYVMSGKFMDRKAIVTLHSTPETNNIYMVNIVFDEENSWYSLKSEFLNIVKSYRAKYKCIDSGRTFLEPYYEGDGFELQGVAKDKCCFFDKYEAEGGTIYVEISDMRRIFIKYIDTFNSKRNERETINKNLEEI